MKKSLKTIIFLSGLFFQPLLMANSSTYTSLETSKCQLIYEDEHSNEYACTGPDGHSLNVLDSGGMQIQFDIKHANKTLSLLSVKAPEVVEYRLNEKNRVIGLIVRVYTYNDEENLSSKLYVYSFMGTIKLIGRVKTNSEAHKLIDHHITSQLKNK